jgi:hypothetical protein
MTALRVQDCGCISLPDDVIEKTSLFPGATFTANLAEDGRSVLITPLSIAQRPDSPRNNTSCG